MSESLAVLGGGSWGTALGWLLGEKGCAVRLWCRTAEQAERIAAAGRNEQYLPDLPLPYTLRPTSDLSAAVSDAALVVVAVPTGAVRETLRRAGSHLPGGTPVVLAAKGLERDTGLALSRVAAEELGADAEARVAVLSGPNLAGEIVRRIPTATTIASHSAELSRRLQETFGTPFFRVYTNADLCGVELGGALKNPIAIGAGIGDGLGFGNNTKASLLTRGLAEIVRLGVAAGARAETFSGLSGLGDLMATAHSPLSRNYRLGLALGRGETLAEAQAALHQVAEGVPTVEAACRLALRLGVEVPIMTVLRGVLYEGRPVREAVEALLSRSQRDEA